MSKHKWNVKTKHFSDNDSVSVYFDDIWLCNEDSREEALKEAQFVLTAAENGARWVEDEFPGLSWAMRADRWNKEEAARS